MNNNTKVVVALLAGLAAGAALGILFAPDKGSVTRKNLADKGKDAADDLKNKYNSAIDALTSKLETVKNEGLNYYEEGKDLAQNDKQNVSNTIK